MKKRQSDLKLQRLQKTFQKILNPDQLKALERKSTRGCKWESNTIKKALRLRFSCGTTGYNELIHSNGFPLPSVRTLQLRLQHINFEPGVLSSVFSYLQAKV